MMRIGSGPLNLGFGLAAALSARTRDPLAQRAVLLAGLGYALAATATSVQYGWPDLTNRLMWSMLLITLPLGANAVRLLLSMRRVGAAEAAGV